MPDLPSAVQARRAIEDRAVELGAERRALKSRQEGNVGAIVGLVQQAEGILPLEEVARLIGVSRQTLYRWQETGGRNPEA